MKKLPINKIIQGDCIEEMKKLPKNSIDTIITDPPYGIAFMGKVWDKSHPTTEIWKEALRVAKPGTIMLCFGGTRTFHRMACGIEDAGWEIRDTMMWIYGCLSEDTEILTEEGWKRYNEITKEDTVFSLDIKKHKLEKSDVNQVFKYAHSGDMVNLENHNTDQLITKNHKVINKKGIRKQKEGKRDWYTEEDWVYRDAWQIDSNQYTLPLASTYDGSYSIGGDLAEIIGWILSEGHYQKDCNAINIYQSSVNQEKIKRIRYCLGRTDIKYSEYERDREYNGRDYIEYQWYISGEDAKRIKKIIPDKQPTKELWNLKLSEKERLITGLCEGDGSKKENGRYSAFYQNDLEFLEWFQVLLHLTGKQGWINQNKMCCSIHYNDSTQIQGKHHKNRIVDYNGVVWCINTDYGNFIARRNGKIFITGNSGFPKSHNIGKAVDRKLGNERDVVGKNPNARETHGKNPLSLQSSPKSKNHKITRGNTKWEGYGTALKPAYEPIIVAMKPNEGSYANNALRHGVSGLNIDGGRIEYKDEYDKSQATPQGKVTSNVASGARPDIYNEGRKDVDRPEQKGRFPSNIIHDGSDEVVKLFPKSKSSATKRNRKTLGSFGMPNDDTPEYGDSGSAARFFYCAKASKAERNMGCEGLEEKIRNDGRDESLKSGDMPQNRSNNPKHNHHPTVKPLKLMEYLCILTKTPTGGIVLDPFAGSGTTGMACKNTGRDYILIEKEPEYCKIAKARIKAVQDKLL